MQPKFKKGDKIRCTSKSMAIGIEVGGIYTVLNPMYYDYGYDISIEVEGLDEVIPYQSRFELVEETNKQPKPNYREMSPDTSIKVSIGGSEFEVSLKELLIVSDITGNIIGEHRASEFYLKTQEILGDHCFDAKGEIDYGNLELDDVYLHYFEPYFSKQKQKEYLKKDIETQKYILETQQALLKDLEVKYNSL